MEDWCRFAEDVGLFEGDEAIMQAFVLLSVTCSVFEILQSFYGVPRMDSSFP